MKKKLAAAVLLCWIIELFFEQLDLLGVHDRSRLPDVEDFVDAGTDRFVTEVVECSRHHFFPDFGKI